MNDFDFLVGTWDVANRCRRRRLAGGDDWEEFPGVARARTFFDGAGSFDEITFPTKGHSGATLRTFDVERQEWSIYWVSSRDGILTPPMIGRFHDGVGTFFGDDTYEGALVRCRFIWSNISDRTARWEQAYSTDGERTWETNWVMDLSRRA
jgi:hypothetical protein